MRNRILTVALLLVACNSGPPCSDKIVRIQLEHEAEPCGLAGTYIAHPTQDPGVYLCRCVWR